MNIKILLITILTISCTSSFNSRSSKRKGLRKPGPSKKKLRNNRVLPGISSQYTLKSSNLDTPLYMPNVNPLTCFDSPFKINEAMDFVTLPIFTQMTSHEYSICFAAYWLHKNLIWKKLRLLVFETIYVQFNGNEYPKVYIKDKNEFYMLVFNAGYNNFHWHDRKSAHWSLSKTEKPSDLVNIGLAIAKTLASFNLPEGETQDLILLPKKKAQKKLEAYK